MVWLGISRCVKPRTMDVRNMPLAYDHELVATFSGGCFWSIEEALSELEGVNEVISGYAGGHLPDPSFAAVGTGKTGHAESVQVYYDPQKIQFSTLAKAFFFAHDPTQLNKQGPDIGNQYRSIAFYRNQSEKKTLDSLINSFILQKRFEKEIVTEIKLFEIMYPAESEHQDYYKLNPKASYSVNISLPKIKIMRKEMQQFLKSEYK